jgi:phosphosulfolactate synthase
MKRAFASISIVARSEKPRGCGVTMIIDYGMGLRQQEDLLSVAGSYVDLAKIRVGSGALYESGLLRSKIDLYKRHRVEVFPGGQFLEYALAQNMTSAYLAEVRDLGFSLVEVSDNRLEISRGEKISVIRTAREEYGLQVLAETGSKVAATAPEDLIEDIKGSLEAGAWKVLLEAAEFFEDGDLNRELIENIQRAVDPERLIFEIPTRHARGVANYDRYSLETWLIKNLGKEVNIGNVAPEEILQLEGLRRNLDSNMDLNEVPRGY